MTIRERDMHETTAATTRARGSTVDRAWLDMAYRPLRIMLGVLFVAFCAVSTIYGVHDDALGTLTKHQVAIQANTGLDAHGAGYAIGVAVAAIIFIGEVVTGERHPLVYMIFLGPDVYYSQNFTTVIADFFVPGEGLVVTSIIFVIALALAAGLAYWGEQLIFGRRRRLGKG